MPLGSPLFRALPSYSKDQPVLGEAPSACQPLVPRNSGQSCLAILWACQPAITWDLGLCFSPLSPWICASFLTSGDLDCLFSPVSRVHPSIHRTPVLQGQSTQSVTGLPTRHPSFNILNLTQVLGLSLQRPCIYKDVNATCLLSYLLLGCFFRFFLDLDLAGQLPAVADL